MKLLWSAALALVVIASASAAQPVHPGQHYSAFASRMVCSQASFQTAPTPAHKLVRLNVTVAGKSTIGYPISKNIWESAGHGVIVRVIQQKHTAPLTVRAASVADCAQVNVLATWR